MHTTSFTLTNTLLDLFSEKQNIGTVEDLRDECARVLEEAGGIWTQDAVNKLYLVDSVIRESMRISSFSILALPRRVSNLMHPQQMNLVLTFSRSKPKKASQSTTTSISPRTSTSQRPWMQSISTRSFTLTQQISIPSASARRPKYRVPERELTTKPATQTPQFLCLMATRRPRRVGLPSH
jgi:hypothetical protein